MKKKQSTHAKSQVSRVSKKAKQVLDNPQETTPRKPPKRGKISEDTSSAQRENTTGLAIFPDELLLEILSHYPDSKNIGKDADAHFARRETLIALSQTCSNLHRFFRPYVWSRIEVFTGMRVSTGVLSTKRQLALELVRQLEVVTIRDPDLAQYVKIVNVMIGDYSASSVLQELARCLAIFQNAHTFRLDHTQLTIPFRKSIALGFSHCVPFPHIRSISLPKEFISLLKYFPGAKYIFIKGPPRYIPNYGDSTFACCPLMENIIISIPSSRPSLPSLVKQFPNIRDITILLSDWIGTNTQSALEFIFSNFRHLKVIRLPQQSVHIKLEKYNQRIISQARKTLLRLQARDREVKTIVLYHRSQSKKVITLPWPPILRSQSQTNLQA